MQNKFTALAAGEPEVMNLKQVRDSMTTFITTVAGMLDFLEDGPLKVKFLEIKEKINTALAGLPTTDQVPAAAQSNVILRDILSMFLSAQDLMKSLSDAAKEVTTKSKTALAGLPEQITQGVTAAIQTQVGAGTLFTKADHEAAVNLAVTNAKTAAATELTANLTKVTARQTVLASAGLAAPDNVILLGTDAEFDAWKTRTVTRQTELKPFKLGPDRLKALMSATDAVYADSLALLKEAGGTPKTVVNRNPFENNTPPAAHVPTALSLC